MTLTEIEAAITEARDLLRRANTGLRPYWKVERRGDDMWELWSQVGGVTASIDRILGEYKTAVRKGTNQ